MFVSRLKIKRHETVKSFPSSELLAKHFFRRSTDLELCIHLKIDKHCVSISCFWSIIAKRIVTFGCHQINNTTVDLDSGNDSLLLKNFDERSSISGLLVDSLVEQDDTGNVGGESIIGGEKQVTVGATILLVVLNSDILNEKCRKLHQKNDTTEIFVRNIYSETLSASGSWLISSQNTLSWGNDGVSDATQLLLQFLWVVVVVSGHVDWLEILGSDCK